MTIVPDWPRQAVGAKALPENSHSSRSNHESQRQYLHDLKELVAEVLLKLREARIGDGVILTQYEQHQFAASPSLEAVVRTACGSTRQTTTHMTH